MNKNEGWVCLKCADERHGVWPSIGEQLVFQICHDCRNPAPCMKLTLLK